MKLRYPAIWTLIFFVCGCSKKVKQIEKTIAQSKDIPQMQLNRHRAKLTDIAIPIDAELIVDKANENTYVYFSSMALNGLEDFFKREMESYGWNLVTSYAGNEISLVFEKPFKFAQVSIRFDANNKKSQVCIFISEK